MTVFPIRIKLLFCYHTKVGLPHPGGWFSWAINQPHIVCLLKQLSSVQKDNSRLRSELEREMALRQNLEMQLQTRDQTLSSLRSELDSRALRADSSPAHGDPERLVGSGVCVCVSAVIHTDFSFSVEPLN